MKICMACGGNKSVREFPRDKQKSDGLHSYCRACKSEAESLRRKIKSASKDAAQAVTCVKCVRPKSGLDMFRYNHHKRSNICISCYDGYGDDIRRMAPEIIEYDSLPASDKRVWHNTISTLRIKLEIVLYMGGQCAHCYTRPGDMWPLRCFECHHLDPFEKEWEIGALALHGARKDFSAIIDELGKCILLCSNCHRREHWRLLREKRYGSECGIDVLGG